MTDPAGRLRVFAYVNADRAALYRAVMRVFMDAKARFTLHLRPQEVTEAVAFARLPEPADSAAVEAALGQLREWGNLEAHPDTAFMSRPQQRIDLQGVDVPKFLTYKETLIGYLERFIGELVVATADIGATLQRIEEQGIDRLLEAAARRDLADALDPTPEDHGAAYAGWQARGAGLRSWFIGRPQTPSQAGGLRARARAALPALLGAVVSINARRVTPREPTAG